MLLYDLMAVYDFNEAHSIAVYAPPGHIFRAIREARPSEVALFRILLEVRSLPAHLAGRGGLGFSNQQPLLRQMLNTGFVLLAEESDQELVLGSVGQFWKLWGGQFPRITNAEEFLLFRDPEYAKALLNFCVKETCKADGARLSTETRVHLTDPIVRRKFAAYWQLIRHWSAFSRKVLLRAIKKRAELSHATNLRWGSKSVS